MHMFWCIWECRQGLILSFCSDERKQIWQGPSLLRCYSWETLVFRQVPTLLVGQWWETRLWGLSLAYWLLHSEYSIVMCVVGNCDQEAWTCGLKVLLDNSLKCEQRIETTVCMYLIVKYWWWIFKTGPGAYSATYFSRL